MECELKLNDMFQLQQKLRKGVKCMTMWHTLKSVCRYFDECICMWGGGSAHLSVSPPHAGKNSYVTTATILYAFNPTPYPNSSSIPFLIVTLE